MNVTSDIKKVVSNEIAQIIENNSEIQFYYNPTILAYQWKDSRFPGTDYVWKNGKYDTVELLVEAFSHHIDCASF